MNYILSSLHYDCSCRNGYTVSTSFGIYYCDPFYCFYRPQRSWGKVMFLHMCVILFTGGGSASVHAGILPPRTRPPWEQTPQIPTAMHAGIAPPRDLLQGMLGYHLQCMLGWHPPLHSACWEVRSTSGRYASYWNAILVFYLLLLGWITTFVYCQHFKNYIVRV